MMSACVSGEGRYLSMGNRTFGSSVLLPRANLLFVIRPGNGEPSPKTKQRSAFIYIYIYIISYVF